MNIQLMKLRKLAGYSNRDDFAHKIGVNKYTYRSWESGAAMMNADQLWNCAVALNCTPNDILGWYENHPNDNVIDDPIERELVECYRASTKDRQDRILDTARDAAAISKDATKRDILPSSQVSA